MFSPVFQEVNILGLNVYENVALAAEGKIDAARVREAVKNAGLSERIESLPDKYDTQLLKVYEANATDLSGGEKQLLTLARALYKDAPMIILDEPTAALDALAEERMYMKFDELCKGKTALYISHRLASTRFCDRILVMEGGSIVEEGTHEELLRRGGVYAKLFETQAESYRDREGTTDEKKR